MRRRALAACLLLLALGCRKDDALEPNDTYEAATVLTPGSERLASVFQNSPDVFVIEAPAGKTLVFKLASRGGEDCPEFTLLGPGEKTLYEDAEGFCSDPWKAKRKEASVQASGGRGSGYEFRVAVRDAGKHYLRIQERGQADNMLGFSWDYALTARVE